MTAEQVFEEVEKLESIMYRVVLTSDSCQVYDAIEGNFNSKGLLIDADFEDTMLGNAVHGLDGLYDKMIVERTDNGTLEKAIKIFSMRRGRG